MNIKSDVKRPPKHLTLTSRVFGLGLGTQVLGFGLGLGTEVLGLGLGLALGPKSLAGFKVLGLGLEPQALVNISGRFPSDRDKP